MNAPPLNTHHKEFGFLWAILAVSALTVAFFFAYNSLFLTPSYTKQISDNTEATAVLIGTHLQKGLFEYGQPFTKETLAPNFDSEIDTVIRDFHIMKIKVFAASGETIFSTEQKDVGVMNTHDYFHSIVAKGKPFTKIVKKDNKSLEGQKVSIDVVETYVPTMADGTFLGAFELYLDITSPKTRLDRLVKHSNQLLQIISGVLLIIIIFIIHRARANIVARREAETKIIEQSTILEETNKDLLILNEISAAISRSIDMDRLLSGILDTITTRFSDFNNEVARGGIFLVNDNKLTLAAHLGHDEDCLCRHKAITTDDCLCGKAVLSGKIIFTPISSPNTGCSLCNRTDTPHGSVVIPLTAQDRVVGVLYIYTTKDVTIADKERLLESIGRQIGLAINNASLYQQTKILALYDQLTGLPNRRYLETKLAEATATADRYGRPMSVAMIDIDFFKKYNDTMGHAAGDQILTTVGGLLRQTMRETDFAARYGGEEFLVIMTETERCGASIGVERMRLTIEQKAGVTISIGVSSYRRGLSVEQLLKEADDALYKAKANGRNRIEWAEAAPTCNETSA